MSHVREPVVQRSETRSRRKGDEDGGASAPLPVDVGPGAATTHIQAMMAGGNGAMVQLAGGDAGDAGAVRQAAASGIQGGGGRMPHAEAIQRSFGGHDVSGVQAHVGGAAAQANKAMGAEAYATGNHVAFANAPNLHTAAHEAAHVVQQRAGVSLSGGVGKAGDSHERHADAVADRVVAGKPAGDLLSQYGGGGGGGQGVQHLSVQHQGGKKKKAPAPKPQQAPQTTTSRSGGATPPTTTAAPESGGAKVTVANTSAFELKLSIPIYGPVKLEGSVAGSYSMKGGSEGASTEVEGMLYGGIAVDLYFMKVTFGIEGKIKFEVSGQEGIIDVVKRGVNEIAQWKLAQDFAPRLATLKSSLTTAYQSSRKEFLAAHSQVVQLVKTNYKEAGNTWWLSKSPRELAVWHQTQWNKALQSGFSGVGTEIAPDKLMDIAGLEARYEKLRSAKSKQEAAKLAQAASNYGVSQLDRSYTRAMKDVDSVQMIKNDPTVGFEASIAFKAGVSVQATPNVAGEFNIAAVIAIGDEKGKKGWDTEAKKSVVVSGKVAVAGFEAELVGDFKDDEFEISGAFKKDWSTAEPEAAQHSIQGIASAVKGGGFSVTGDPLGTLKAVGKEVGAIVKSESKAMLDASAIAERRAGKMNAGGGIGIEVKLKFAPSKGKKPQGGSVKITITSMKLDAEKALGKTAAVGVSGSISNGTSFEVAWG